MLAACVLVALSGVGSAWAGPVPVPWGTDAAPTVAQPQPLADGQVMIGPRFPTLLDTGRAGDYEYALVTQNAGVARAEDEPGHGIGRAHLFVLRRRVNEVDPARPWEQLGGQIDEMDPARDRDTEELGVQIARMVCDVDIDGGCWVAYAQEGHVTLARPVAAGHGFSWERAQLDSGTVRGVGALALEVLQAYYVPTADVAWAQFDRDSPTHSTVRLARVTWPTGQKHELDEAVSLGSGDRVQLVYGAAMVDDASEIRIYDTSVASYDRPNGLTGVLGPDPFLTLPRAQATGRALLASWLNPRQASWIVAEPAPGGTLVHVVGFDEQDTKSYRFVNPAWLPSGAGPMALTSDGDRRGWMVVGMPGWPGSALVQITGRPDDTLGAVVYQIPNLPAPVGLDLGGLPRVFPEVIGAINATTDDGPPTVDLISSANLIRGGAKVDVEHPLGELHLLASRVITTRPAIE